MTAPACNPEGPEALATLHAACFVTPRPWSAAEIAGLITSPGSFLLQAPEGFLIGRAIAGEAEVLTLAVAPAARRQGLGRSLVARFIDRARQEGADRAFLEVAADNAPALALYAAAGFAEAGRRRSYYRQPDGRPLDALVLVRPLSPQV